MNGLAGGIGKKKTNKLGRMTFKSNMGIFKVERES